MFLFTSILERQKVFQDLWCSILIFLLQTLFTREAKFYLCSNFASSHQKPNCFFLCFQIQLDAGTQGNTNYIPVAGRAVLLWDCSNLQPMVIIADFAAGKAGYEIFLPSSFLPNRGQVIQKWATFQEWTGICSPVPCEGLTQPHDVKTNIFTLPASCRKYHWSPSMTHYPRKKHSKQPYIPTILIKKSC